MKPEQMIKHFYNNPDGLSDEELLELLLRFCSDDPRSLAQRLLAQYPSMEQLMETTAQDLSAVDGMDQDAVLLLQLVPELHRRYFLSQTQRETRLKTSNDYGRYLLPYFYGVRDEVVYLLLLDSVGKVMNCRKIGQGSVNSANVPIRKLVQEALLSNASAAVLAHNHPNGVAIPSKEDIEVTVYLRDTLAALDIILIDHVVVADDDFVSIRDSGYLRGR